MADYIAISEGSGATVATDDVSGAHYQMVKIVDGTADSANRWKVDSAGSAQVAVLGNLTISDSKAFIGLASVELAKVATYGGKTLRTTPFAINTTQLSGSTVFVNASSNSYRITNLILSNASAVGVAVMSGVTYVAGNASVRMQLAANSGFVETGSPQSPVYFGLNTQQSFSIVTDTDAPVAGKVIWYEE